MAILMQRTKSKFFQPNGLSVLESFPTQVWVTKSRQYLWRNKLFERRIFSTIGNF